MTGIAHGGHPVNRLCPAPGLPEVMDGCNRLILLVDAAIAGRAKKAANGSGAVWLALDTIRFVLGQAY